MSHPSQHDVQSAYSLASVAYGHTFEMKAFLEQASESIQPDETELLRLLQQAQEKANNALLVTREAEQAIAELLTFTIRQG